MKQSFFNQSRRGGAAVNNIAPPTPTETAQAAADETRHEQVEQALEVLPAGTPILAVVDPDKASTPPAGDDYEDFCAAVAAARDPETEIAMLQERTIELNQLLAEARRACPAPAPTNPWLEALGTVGLVTVGALLGGALAVAGRPEPKPWYAPITEFIGL